MKILQILFPVGIGGAEGVAYHLYMGTKNAGWDSKIAITTKMAKPFCKRFKINNTKDLLLIDDKNIYSQVKSVFSIIKKFNPDIIQTHARRECVIASLYPFKRYKHVRTQHMAESPKIWVSPFEQYFLAKNVDLWIATSGMLEDQYFSNIKYTSHAKICHIYNGVPDLYLSNHTYVRHNKFCIISRLTTQKGIDILLKKIEEIPFALREKIQIDIYGSGPELNNIMNIINENNMNNNIHYCGSTDDPRSLFKDYDALLMPSRYEGLPLTALESMSFCLPVATHDVGCMKDFIVNGENGWIIDENFGWESFFSNFLTMTDDAILQIREKARKTFLQKFSCDVMINEYIKKYSEILN